MPGKSKIFKVERTLKELISLKGYLPHGTVFKAERAREGCI